MANRPFFAHEWDPLAKVSQSPAGFKAFSREAGPKDSRGYFRFYFHLLIFLAFLDFEVVLSGKKWIEVAQSGFTPIQGSPLGDWLKGDTGAATTRKLTGHGG